MIKIIQYMVRIILLFLVINIIVYMGIILVSRELPEYGGTYVGYSECQEISSQFPAI